LGQIAYCRDSGVLIEAFSLSDPDWNKLCAAPLGAILMPRTNWPAIPKVSIKGLKFFAHHQGYTGIIPKPKSYAHTRLQIDIVKTARKMGFTANLEVPGSSDNEEDWIADVMIEGQNGSKTAFEVQFSSQHLDDFLNRTKRYKNSGVNVCWFLSEKPVAWRLCKALCHKNIDYYKKTGHFMSEHPELITFNIDINDKNSYPKTLPDFRFSRGFEYIKRLSLEQCIIGMMNGYPVWSAPDWVWEEK
jgi:hypothetical protein